MSMTATATSAPRYLWSRRRIGVAVLVVIVLLIAGDLIAGRIAYSKLTHALEQRSSLRLHAAMAWYVPPWGLYMNGVQLSQALPDGTLRRVLSAAGVTLRLDHLPHQGERPALKQVSVAGGVISWGNDNSRQLQIDHLFVDVHPDASDSNLYHISINSDQSLADWVAGDGELDASTYVLKLQKLHVRADIASALSHAPLPDNARQAIAKYQPAGGVDLQAAGEWPLHDAGGSTGWADVKLDGLGATLDDGVTRVENGKVDVHLDRAADGQTSITLRSASLSANASLLSLDGGKVVLAADDQTWKLAGLLGRFTASPGIPALDRLHLTGNFRFTGAADGPTRLPDDGFPLAAIHHELIVYPNDAAIQPATYPIPIDHITGGPIIARQGVVHMQNLLANYGGDQVLLDDAHITLEDPQAHISLSDLSRQVRIEGISGQLICRQPGPEYPAGLGKVMAQLRPRGTFSVGGGSWYAINPRLPNQTQKPKGDYFFRVSTAGGAFALTAQQTPLTDIHADATISPLDIVIRDFRADAFKGIMTAKLNITPARPAHYAGDVTFYNADLATALPQVGAKLSKPLVGTAYLTSTVSIDGPGGTVSPLDSLEAKGKFEVVNGNFGNVAAIRAASTPVAKPDQPLDGQAAGAFSIGKQQVKLWDAVLGNPTFGLAGDGTVNFDGNLDLHLAAAPLGDWQTNLQRSGVPIVNSVGSQLMGAIQLMFNGAQRTLLWDIRVTGTAKAPKVTPTPVPVITAPLAAIFGQVMQGQAGGQLEQQLRPATRPAVKPSPASAPAAATPAH